MQGGGARPNQFRVKLHFPAVVGALGTRAGNEAVFTCRAASLPASNISDIVLGYRGRPVHFAGERDFQPWSVSILNDTTFVVRDAFEEWNHAIVEYNTTRGLVTPRRYLTELHVEQLDRNDNPIKGYTFHDAYPTTVGEIQLSFDNNNTIEEFGVQFVYNYYTPDNIVPNEAARQQ